MSNQHQPPEDPPLLKMRLTAIAIIVAMLFIALWFSRAVESPEEEVSLDCCFLEARNEPIIHLEFFQENYLVSKAPPFLVDGRTLATFGEEKFDEDKYNRMIECESKDDPTADNPNSTAYGVCQMIDGTWKYVQIKWNMKLDRHSYYDQHYACRRLMKEEGMDHWVETEWCWQK